MAVLAGPYLVTVGLLGAAGALKVVRPSTTARALREMGVPASPALVRLGAAVELAVAGGALAAGGPAFAGLVAASYLAFGLFVLAALRRGTPLSSCGCFGATDTPPTTLHLALNVAAAAVAGAVAVGAAGGGGLSEIGEVGGSVLLQGAFVVLVVASAWLAYVALTLLPRLSGVGRP